MPPTHLFLDFDGTITERDTIASLASIAYQVRASHLPALPPWSYFTQAYIEDLRAYEESHPRREGESTTLEAEIEYLSGMRDVEMRSIKRIEKAGVFVGLKKVGSIRL